MICRTPRLPAALSGLPMVPATLPAQLSGGQYGATGPSVQPRQPPLPRSSSAQGRPKRSSSGGASSPASDFVRTAPQLDASSAAPLGASVRSLNRSISNVQDTAESSGQVQAAALQPQPRRSISSGGIYSSGSPYQKRTSSSGPDLQAAALRSFAKSPSDVSSRSDAGTPPRRQVPSPRGTST